MSEFQRCLAVTLKFEGGKSDNPNDPGGRTMFGVTQKVYTAWRIAQNLVPQDVYQMSALECQSIYYTNYWQQAGCDVLVWPMDLLVFDCAVNSGVGRAREFLSYTTDPGTYLSWRLTFVRWLARKPTAAIFLKGWTRRITTLEQTIGLTSLPSIP